MPPLTKLRIYTMKEIIKKWYDILKFPKEYDSAFEKLLLETRLTPSTVDKYKSMNDYKTDLLMSLYFCEATAKKAEKQGLPFDVLLNSLSDIVTLTKIYYREYNTIGLSGYGWTTLAHRLYLHKLGRLEFMPSAGKMEVHIPRGEPFPPKTCIESFKSSVEFFGKYYPDFKYDTYYTDSWLLDDTLAQFLNKDSNILNFARLFEKSKKTESDDAIHFVFGSDAARENLSEYEIKNSFMQKLYDYVMNGGKLYRVYGEIKKEDIIGGKLEKRLIKKRRLVYERNN